jgi:large subunit ribosomal protein L10
MLKQDKTKKIEYYDGVVGKSAFAIFTEFSKIPVPTVEKWRHDMAKLGGTCIVLKNTLARIVFERNGAEAICEHLVLPTFAFFGPEDITPIAKLVQRYMREFPSLKVKAILFDGKVYSQQEFKSFLTMPTKNEVRASLLRVMMAPQSKMVRVLNAPQRMVSVLAAFADKQAG